MAKFITAQEAAKLIPDGATVGVAGMGLSGWAEEVACAMRDSFRELKEAGKLHHGSGTYDYGDWAVWL